jgi:hypothetical protein
MTIGFFNFSLLVKIYLAYTKFKHLTIIIVTNTYIIKSTLNLVYPIYDSSLGFVLGFQVNNRGGTRSLEVDL